MSTARERIWGRDFVLASVVNTFIALAFYLLMTSMALYAAQRFQASETMAGLAASMFIIGALVARVFIGKLLDIIGRRRSLVAGLIVFVVASLLYDHAGSLPLLLTLRFLHGVAFGIANTAISAGVQSLIPPSRRSEGTGYFALSTTLSTALGPFLAMVLTAGGGYATMFLFCAAFSVAGLIVALLVRLPEHPASAQTRAQWWRLRAADVLDPTTLPIASVVFFAGVSYSGIITFITSYTRSRDLGNAAGTFFVVYAIAVLVSRLFVGRIQDELGDNAVMVPTLLIFALALAVLSSASTGVMIAAAGAMTGFGFGAMTPCAQAIVVGRSSISRVGVVTSTFYLLLDAGTGLGPILLGALVTRFGYPPMYLTLSIVMVGATALYYVVHGRAVARLRVQAAPSPVAREIPARPRVLVGADGSDDGLRAVAYAVREARVTDSDLWVVHVVDDAVTGGDWGAFFQADALEDIGQAGLSPALELVAEAGFPSDRVISETLVGHPADVLIGLSEQARLTVLGRRSVRGLDRMFVGSTSVAVAGGAASPLVVISAASTPQVTGGFGVIAAAVPAGSDRLDVLRWTLAEAAHRGARVRVVQIQPSLPGGPGTGEGPAGPSPAWLAKAADYLADALAHLQTSYPGVAIEVETLSGVPVRELVDLSRAVDLLVLDAHPRRDGTAHAQPPTTLGGVVRGVMAHAYCPVAVPN